MNRPGEVDTRITVEDLYPIVVGGKSNCYMVKPGTAVTIPVERANESPIAIGGSTIQLQSATAWKAELVWESAVGLVCFSGSEDVGIGPSGRFKVIAPHASNPGNAVIAIKNEKGEILWSWHIWVTDYDGSTQFTNNNGKRVFIFMDRALGASTSTAGQLTSCGLMYQWGRKDPFPSIGQQGGNWIGNLDNTDPIRVYNASGNPYEVTKTSVPSTATPNNLTNAIRYPDTFYNNATSPNDWFVYNSPSDQNNDLWSGSNIASNTAAAKSVFDPCPAGWRIPSWLNSASPFAKMNSGWGWGNYGQSWSCTGGYFPASGYRGSLNRGLCYVSANGYYWSGTPYITNSYSLNFNSGVVNPANYDARANGFAVRCSKDE